MFAVPNDYRQCALLLFTALAGWACSGGPTGPSSPCGPSTVRAVSLSDSIQLFSPGRIDDGSSATTRYYFWDFAVDSACTHAVPGQDSITFTVSTSASLPPSFTVTGIASDGNFAFAVDLDRFSTEAGYVFSGTQKTFDLETNAGAPSISIMGAVQVSFPAVGTPAADSALLQRVMQNLTVRFDYHVP